MNAAATEPGGLKSLIARRRIGIVVVLVAVAALLWLPGTLSIGPMDRDEARFAQATKQMLETGDLVDIRFQDEARHKKPVGIYWLQAAAAVTVGDGAASPIWVYRLPSLAGALAAVLLTAALAGHMFGATAGLIAGLGLASTVILGVEARLAKTDATLLACVVLAQLALWRVFAARDEADRGGRWWIVFWSAQGLAILVKGPIGPLVALLTVVTLVAFERRPGWLSGLRPGRGLALAAAVAAPWFIAITIASDGAFFQASLGADLLGKVHVAQESHGAPPGTYLAAAWLTAWPLVALVPLALVWMWRNRTDDRARFLAAWIFGFWLILELTATKLPHYVMPVYPALAIAAAAAISQSERRRSWLLGLPLAVVLALGIGLAGAALALPRLLGEPLPGIVLLGAALATVLLVATWPAYTAGRWRVAGVRGLAAAVVLYATIFGGLFPRMQSLALSPRMAEAVGTYAACADPVVATVGYHEPSAVFELGTDTRLADIAEATALLAQEPCALVFIDDRRADAFEAALEVPARRLTALRGYRLNGGRFTTLTLYGPSR